MPDPTIKSDQRFHPVLSAFELVLSVFAQPRPLIWAYERGQSDRFFKPLYTPERLDISISRFKATVFIAAALQRCWP